MPKVETMTLDEKLSTLDHFPNGGNSTPELLARNVKEYRQTNWKKNIWVYYR